MPDTWEETPGQQLFRIGVRQRAIERLLYTAFDPDDEEAHDDGREAWELLEAAVQTDPTASVEQVQSLLEQAYDQGWNAALHNERSKTRETRGN